MMATRARGVIKEGARERFIFVIEIFFLVGWISVYLKCLNDHLEN